MSDIAAIIFNVSAHLLPKGVAALWKMSGGYWHIGALAYIRYRTAPILGSSDIRILLNIDMVSSPISEQETFSPTKFSLKLD